MPFTFLKLDDGRKKTEKRFEGHGNQYTFFRKHGSQTAGQLIAAGKGPCPSCGLDAVVLGNRIRPELYCVSEHLSFNLASPVLDGE